jgi:ribosomal protein S15
VIAGGTGQARRFRIYLPVWPFWPVHQSKFTVRWVATLARINELNGHFKAHAKDHHSRRGLIMMVNRRKSLLSYLKSKDATRYRDLIAKLGLRK